MKVWDLPTRLFHWSIVALLILSWWSAENGQMEWHYRSGVAALVLVTFRLIWGFIGGKTARFSHFLRGPTAAIAYLRRSKDSPPVGGHNPLGGYSVIAMLVALAVQVGTGLLAVDVDGIESGPLSYLVSFDDGRVAAQVHHFAFTALQALIVLHLVSIAYYRARGRQLVRPMVTGHDSQLQAGEIELVRERPLKALCALAVACLFGWWVNAGAPF